MTIEQPTSPVPAQVPAQVPPPPGWDASAWLPGPGLPPPPPPARGAVPWTAGVAALATLAILACDFVLGTLAWPVLGDLYFAFGSLLVLGGGSVLLATRHGRWGWRALLGRRPRWSDVGLGLVGAAVVVFCDDLLSRGAAALLPAGDGGAQGWIDASLVAAPLLTTVAVVLTGPIAEELVFRGVLFRGLRRRFRLAGALLISTAAFAAVHPSDLSAASLVLLASVAIAGLVFAGLLEWRGTIVAPIVAHIAVNAWATSFTLFAVPWSFPVGPGEVVETFDLEVGECTDGYPDAGATSGRWTALDDCTVPHDLEVFVAASVGEPDEPYPGPEEVSMRIEDLCFTEFESYVGRDYYQSQLDYLALWPNEAAWTAGERAARCVLHPMDRTPTTGSAEGSGS